MTIQNVTVTDASYYSPGFWMVTWNNNVAVRTLIRVNGQDESVTDGRVGSNELLVNGNKYGAGSHTICVVEDTGVN